MRTLLPFNTSVYVFHFFDVSNISDGIVDSIVSPILHSFYKRKQGYTVGDIGIGKIMVSLVSKDKQSI